MRDLTLDLPMVYLLLFEPVKLIRLFRLFSQRINSAIFLYAWTHFAGFLTDNNYYCKYKLQRRKKAIVVQTKIL